jgi:hypothetical protein
MELTQWKMIAGGAAIVGASVGALAASGSDEPIELNDPLAVVQLSDTTIPDYDLPVVADSPESPDSPNESAQDSPAPAPVQPAGDSPDSPDSPDSNDT